jgi:DNA replication protein DnaC
MPPGSRCRTWPTTLRAYSPAPNPPPWATSTSSTSPWAKKWPYARAAGSPRRSTRPDSPHHKGLGEFDFTFQPDLDPRKIRDLAALEFVPSHHNITPLGPPGVGTTHLAVALAVAACSAGYSVYFTSLDEAIRQLRLAETTGRFAKKLQTYLRPAVLVLDEVGYLPLDRPAANMVFQLISRRYERGSIILTSNKTFSEWGNVFTDDVLATAILDRLLHHCHVISINGPSYRLKDRVSLAPTPTPMP